MAEKVDTSRLPSAPPELAGIYAMLQSQDSRIEALNSDFRQGFRWLIGGGIGALFALYLLLDKRADALEVKFTAENKSLRDSISASSDRMYDKLMDLHASVVRLEGKSAAGAAAPSSVQDSGKTETEVSRP